MVNSELLTVAQSTEITGYSRRRSYQLIKKGILPSRRIAGSIRIPRQALEAWIDAQAGAALAACQQDTMK